MRRAAKVDSNQKQIVKDLRKLGFSVLPGHDDILIGYQGLTVWVEIKSPDTIGKDGEIKQSKIRESQKKLASEWRGQYWICSSTEEILENIKNLLKVKK